jgi:hypothetical protein
MEFQILLVVASMDSHTKYIFLSSTTERSSRMKASEQDERNERLCTKQKLNTSPNGPLCIACGEK